MLDDEAGFDVGIVIDVIGGEFSFFELSFGPVESVEGEGAFRCRWLAVFDIDVGEEKGLAIRPAVGRDGKIEGCLLYTSPSPRDQRGSRMPSSA